ncbi:unnamed protein product [Phaedon cochleariae]|uniref:Pre-C2HC domain-containing protein n=1 Tax=Phaedon cochleariae TaxID=80249 RepID=A0A9N9X4S3_PHACE|nr:unnamed protein product [Phaedon cochleariae]
MWNEGGDPPVPGMDCLQLRHQPAGPFHYLISEQAKSLVALQELQHEVGALLEFRDLVMATFPDLRSKLAASTPSTMTSHHHLLHHPHQHHQSNIPVSIRPGDWTPGVRVRKKIGSKEEGRGGRKVGEVAVQDSGFSTETSSKETHSASSSSAVLPSSSAPGPTENDEVEDELWNLLDIIHRKGTRLKDEAEALQGTLRHQGDLRKEDDRSFRQTLFHSSSVDDVRQLRQERDSLIDRLAEMEAEVLAGRVHTSRLQEDLENLLSTKQDLEEQLKAVVTQRVNSRIHDLHLQFVKSGAGVADRDEPGGRRPTGDRRDPPSSICSSQRAGREAPSEIDAALGDEVPRVGAPDGRKVAAILRERDPLVLQKHLLTTTVRNQTNTNLIRSEFSGYSSPGNMLNLPEDLDGDSLVTLLHQILERLNKLNPHNQLSIRPVSDQPQSDHLPKYGKRPFQDTNDLHETNYEKEFPMIPLSNRFDQLSELQDDEMSECSSVKSSSSQKSVRARKSLSDRNVRDDISCPYFNSQLRSRSRSPQMPQMSQFQQNSVQLKRQGSKVPMNSQHKPSSSSLRDSIPTKIDKNNVSVNQNVDNHQVRVPPIILRDKTKWTSLSKELPTLQINYFKAVNTTEGIKVFCDSPDSFRALTRLLDNKKYPFHTYQLPDEKSLRVVLRNVSEHIEPDDISEELTERGFEVTSVHRMKRRDGTAMPIVLVLLPKTEKNREIYDITRLVGLTIKVEPQRPKAQVLREQLDSAAGLEIGLRDKLDKAREENEDLRFQLEDRNIELEGTRARVRMLESLAPPQLRPHPTSPDIIPALESGGAGPPTPSTRPEVSTASMRAMQPLDFDSLRAADRSSGTESAHNESAEREKKSRRPSKIPLKSYTAPKPPAGKHSPAPGTRSRSGDSPHRSHSTQSWRTNKSEGNSLNGPPKLTASLPKSRNSSLVTAKDSLSSKLRNSDSLMKLSHAAPDSPKPSRNSFKTAPVGFNGFKASAPAVNSFKTGSGAVVKKTAGMPVKKDSSAIGDKIVNSNSSKEKSQSPWNHSSYSSEPEDLAYPDSLDQSIGSARQSITDSTGSRFQTANTFLWTVGSQRAAKVEYYDSIDTNMASSLFHNGEELAECDSLERHLSDFSDRK